MTPQSRPRARPLVAGAASALAAGTALAAPAIVQPAIAAGAPPRAAATPLAAPLPDVSALPAAIVPAGRAGATPLVVDLPTPLRPGDLRAAIAAAGAIERAAPAPGFPIQVITGSPSAAQLATAPGPLVRIVHRSGPGALALDRTGGGPLRLTISGAGESLMNAARALDRPEIAALHGTSSTVPRGFAPQRTAAPVAHEAPLAPFTVSGGGVLRGSTSFTLPVDRQLTGQDPLQLVTAYDAPGGGRIELTMSNGSLGTWAAPASGSTRQTVSFKLADDPTLSGDLLPGYWTEPGVNPIRITATPSRAGAAGTLQLLQGSKLVVRSRPRPPALQLGLWPFPLYAARAWADTTLVLGRRTPPNAALAALVGALATAARITGVPADPRVVFGAPTAAQAARGRLILFGAAAASARAGRMPVLGRLRATEPPMPGVLEETKTSRGALVLLSYGTAGMAALSTGYTSGSLLGRAVLIDAQGRPHTLASGEAITVFRRPGFPWIAPTAFLALLALGWVGARVIRARRRLTALPAFEVVGGEAR